MPRSDDRRRKPSTHPRPAPLPAWAGGTIALLRTSAMPPPARPDRSLHCGAASTRQGQDAHVIRRRLPIGIQTFRKIREEGCYYVDKTAYVARLVGEGTHFFLSRPRRFGKSLFVDTLKELFEGSEPLFRGLEVHDGWDWSRRHPVVRLDFSGGNFRRPGFLEEHASAQIEDIGKRAGVGSGSAASPPIRFRRLVEALSERAGRRVAVLVDEYDKPILDAMDDPDVARSNRDDLRGLYGTIKACDAQVAFTFITGVSKFSKVSLFSDLNNLTDITLDPDYSAICGYTEEDVDTVFAAELPGLDRDEIRDWYNGYNWLGDERVYNPYDILHLFRSRRFEPHWYRTGAPAFLVQTLTGRGVGTMTLEDVHAGDARLNVFDVDAVGTEALLFQSGYLTIRDAERQAGRTVYRLGYPNREVRQSLNESFLDHLLPDLRQEQNGVRLLELLRADDVDGLEEWLRSLFAGIPYEWHARNDIARYKGYYASVFYSHFAALGLDLAVEDSTSHGRLDMAVRFAGLVYLFEFKVVEQAPEGAALAQLKEKGYAEQYRGARQPIRLIGVEFSREARNIVAFETERVA